MFTKLSNSVIIESTNKILLKGNLDMNQDKSKAGVMVGAAAVVALIVGMAGGYAIGNNSSDDTTNTADTSVSETDPRTDTKAATLRVNLNNALSEHIELASPALRAVFDGAPSADGATKALDENSVAIATAIDSVYPGNKDKFLELWRNHIGFFVDYTVAAKAGDQAGMDKARADLEGYTDQASTFFSEANPNLPKDAVQEGLKTHLNQVIAIVDAYGAKDFEKSYAIQREADMHIQMFGDTLSGAIVKQFPEKF